jgi:hypothetical protein
MLHPASAGIQQSDRQHLTTSLLKRTFYDQRTRTISRVVDRLSSLQERIFADRPRAAVGRQVDSRCLVEELAEPPG